MLQKSLTYNGYTKKASSSRKRSKKRKSKVKRESVLRPSIYQKIQKQRKSQLAIAATMSSNSGSLTSHTATLSSAHSLPSSTLFTSNTTLSLVHYTSAKRDNRRTVFISLHGLYECWRNVPAHILFDAIFILPLYKRWLQSPLKHIGYAHDFSDILSDQKFLTLLQWKQRQGLIFFMLDAMDNNDILQQRIRHQKNTTQHSVAPFWYHLSNKLQSIYDPDTCDSYRPLLLSERWWKLAYSNMYCSKYNVSTQEILNELHFITMKFKTMQEILYQSNTSLNVVITYSVTPQLIAIRSILSMKPKLKMQPTAPKHEEEEIEIDQVQSPSFKIQIANSDDDDNYLSCDTLISPSNDSSSHIIDKQAMNMSIMNSGSESDDDMKDNYDKASSSSSAADSVSSSALAPIVPFADGNEEKKSFSSQSTALSRRDTLDNVEHEWWVCPSYYYDTIKTKADTDCDHDFED